MTKKPVVTVEPPKEIKVRIRVEVNDLNPKIAKFIKAGDSRTEGSGDNREVIARIVKIISDKPAEVVSLNKSRTGFNILKHPQTRDMILDIEIFYLPNPEGISFQGKPVKIGKAFEFSTNLYSISGTVIEMGLK